jgi:hypothetical protein
MPPVLTGGYLLSGGTVEDISKEIKIIHEMDDSAEDFCSIDFKDANQALCEAERIYFLGFGFYEDNIRRFNFFSNDSLKDKEILATAYNLGSTERKNIVKRMSKYGFSSEILIHSTCNNFFKNYGILE